MRSRRATCVLCQEAECVDWAMPRAMVYAAFAQKSVEMFQWSNDRNLNNSHVASFTYSLCSSMLFSATLPHSAACTDLAPASPLLAASSLSSAVHVNTCGHAMHWTCARQ